MALVVDTDWAAPLRRPHRAPAGRRREGAGRGRPCHPRGPRHPDTSGRTASTSAWRSSRPPGRPGCASTTTAAATAFAGKPFREARSFEKAYLIQLFQHMIEAGETFAHVDTPGEYIEIDTQQDFDYARRHWPPASTTP